MKSLLKFISLSLIAIFLSACCRQDAAIEQVNKIIAQQKIDHTQKDWKTKLTQPEQLNFTPNKNYYWDLKTNQGEISILLYKDVAPMHVTSTIFLTKLGFYDNIVFHRVIPGFMAQGGDPLGNGTGNPGYKYAGEFDGKTSHDTAGVLSMANAGPNTDGSQFFITFKATPFLDNKHTVFGKVTTDLYGVMDKIESLGQRSGRTKTEIKIIKAKIRVESAA